MPARRSPDASDQLLKRILDEKEKRHRRQARMSFARKLAVLDAMFEDAKRTARRPDNTTGRDCR